MLSAKLKVDRVPIKCYFKNSWWSASDIPKYSSVSFSLSVLFLSCFGCFQLSDICLFPFLIISMAHFSIPNTIPIYLHTLTFCIRVSDSVSFLFLQSA